MYSHQSIEADDIARRTALKHSFENINRFIDHTLLKPDATLDSYRKLCQEAVQYQFRTVCVPPTQVKFAADFFKKQGSEIGVCTVVSFPLGYATTLIKVAETEEAIALGAMEIDFVQNVTLVKNKQWGHWEHESASIVAAANGRLVKIILETSLLSDDELRECSLRATACGVHVIKTSTGFGARGASLADVSIINETLADVRQKSNRIFGIKASGGVRTRADAIAMISAGATRLGTSNGVAICLDSGLPVSAY